MSEAFATSPRPGFITVICHWFHHCDALLNEWFFYVLVLFNVLLLFLGGPVACGNFDGYFRNVLLETLFHVAAHYIFLHKKQYRTLLTAVH